MRLAGLAAAEDIAIGSLFDAGAEQGSIVGDFTTIDALPAQTEDVGAAVANARSTGMAHMRVASSSDIPELDASTPGLVVVRVLCDGRCGIDVAVLANLSVDPHPPGPGCFESYELVEAGELMTPDLSVDVHDGAMTIVAMYAVVDRGRMTGLLRRPSLTLQVHCDGRPGEPSTVEYRLQWGAR